MADKAARRTRNPVVSGLSPTVSTYWICSWSFRVVRNPRLRLLIANWLLPASCVFQSCSVVFKLFVSKSLSGVPVN